jgi:hypothetical protein
MTGFFPGNSIVPGTLILDEVIFLLAQELPQNANVLGGRRPQEICDLEFKGAPEGICKFECRCGERLIANGLPLLGSESGQ